jgi:hypothetical protein
MAFFVPEGVAPGTPVAHHGVNVIPPVRTFQKVFARSTDEASVGGLNVYALSPLVGDGFFYSDHVSVGRMFPSGGSDFSRFTFVLCRQET